MTTADIRLTPELHFSEITSVSPEGKNQFESFQATNVLGGQELTKELQGTLGATLETSRAIALRSFGPGPARPVIRGLDGDRVLIVEDGLRMGDLSSQSGDHGVNVNPASASSIEVVRGPATLLYGANAIGGLVNVVTNDDSDRAGDEPDRASRSTPRRARQAPAAPASVTVGNGRFALHAPAADAGPTTSRRPTVTMPNSFNRAATAEVGGSVHVGPRLFRRQLRVRPHALRHSVRGGRRDQPRIRAGRTSRCAASRGTWRASSTASAARSAFAATSHDELDGDVVATAFENNTTELELLAHHRRLGTDEGIDRRSLLTRNFSATGEEALSPDGRSERRCRLRLRGVAASRRTSQVQFGGRVEHADVRAAAE